MFVAWLTANLGPKGKDFQDEMSLKTDDDRSGSKLSTQRAEMRR